MTELRTLSHISLAALTEVFNRSFARYFVPINLTEGQLLTKIKSENIDLDHSVGAFDGDKLVGFMLHATESDANVRRMYNAGTGVLPEYRGRALTKQMYQFILPRLAGENIASITLEVIDQNLQAIKSYQSVGFAVTRQLDCFTGEVFFASNKGQDITIKPLTQDGWKGRSAFWDIEPTWQNSNATLTRLGDSIAAKGAYRDGVLEGYILFDPASKRIRQLAVSEAQRRSGIGKALVTAIMEEFGTRLTVINVDRQSAEAVRFLQGIGLVHFLTQLEMRFEL